MAATHTSGASVEGFENAALIECLARFAIDEFNQIQNALVLQFVKVLDATHQQFELGTLYELTVLVVYHVENKKGKFKAAVWITGNSKKLVDFKLVDDA